MYSALLLGRTQLQQEEIILLDRIQKKLPVTQEGVKKLRNVHLVEGRYPNIRIAKEVEQLVSNLREQSQGAPVSQGVLSTKILLALQKQNLSRKQIAEYCNVQIKTGSLSKALRQLLKLGLIERTETKLYSHNQAYRMTESGQLYLENQS